MNFSEALREVESNNFDAMVNLASGFRLLFDIARQQGAVQALWKELALPENQEALLSHVKELAAKRQEPEDENPHDAAFVVYLWLLSLKNPEFASEAAEIIAKVPHCFWANDGARFYLQVGKPLSEAPDAADEVAVAKRAAG